MALWMWYVLQNTSTWLSSPRTRHNNMLMYLLVGLEEYLDTFIDNGYDAPEDLADLEASDLDHMKIMDPAHRNSLLVSGASESLQADCLTHA